MFFKKKKSEFEEKEIEQITEEYTEGIKVIIRKYLPRKMRRAMYKGKGGGRLTQDKKNEEIQKIKKTGISAWLNQATEEVFEELSSFVTDPGSLRSELNVMLKEFKKKWNIK